MLGQAQGYPESWCCPAPRTQLRGPTLHPFPSPSSPDGECGPWQKKWLEFITSNIITDLERPSDAKAGSEPWGMTSYEVPVLPTGR